ncbi:MAG: hypothetical protein JO295_13800 [Verrucomicrobia bacterium]|nr:hypothetical protein [Verrucomicrobiota bacterium]
MKLSFPRRRPLPAAALLMVLTMHSAAVVNARAQQPQPPQKQPTPAARSNAAIAGDFVLKNHSTFTTPGGDGDATAGRNPFLPIGYARAVATQRAEAAPDVRAEQFAVTATLLDVPPLTVINGKSYTTGERIPLNASGTDFVTVKQIGDGVVYLDYRGRILTCKAGMKPAGKPAK